MDRMDSNHRRMRVPLPRRLVRLGRPLQPAPASRLPEASEFPVKLSTVDNAFVPPLFRSAISLKISRSEGLQAFLVSSEAPHLHLYKRGTTAKVARALGVNQLRGNSATYAHRENIGGSIALNSAAEGFVLYTSPVPVSSWHD
jgi:hypothetical protein